MAKQHLTQHPADIFDQGDQFLRIVRIHLCCCDDSVRCFSSFSFKASHFDFVLLAMQISVKVLLFWQHL